MPAPSAKRGKYSALFSKNKKTATENLGGCIMKIVYVLKVLFFFVWFYSSFVLVYEGVDVVLPDFHIVLH